MVGVVAIQVQGSLFDHTERRSLDHGAWIELRSDWLTDADELFEGLLTSVPWRAERRQMYDRVVDVPRLVSFHDLTTEPAPHPLLNRVRRRLNDIYAGELGEPFTTAGMCLYRDGSDSVAWHGDTIGRSRREDTMVAIVSLGATRTFALRSRQTATADDTPDTPGNHDAHEPGATPPLRLPQRHGDLLVMGGSCQRTWEHSIPKAPKTAAPVGPRISVQFRPRDVR